MTWEEGEEITVYTLRPSTETVSLSIKLTDSFRRDINSEKEKKKCKTFSTDRFMEREEKLKEAERQMEINGTFTPNLETKQHVFRKTGCNIPSLRYLVCGVEAMSGTVRLGQVQDTHLSTTRFQ